MDVVTGGWMALVALALYFIPALVAGYGEHPQRTAIFVLNLLLGWTLVGWVLALVWAFIKPATPSAGASPVVTTSSELERLAELHRSGALTSDEFAAAKAKVVAGA